MSRLALPEDVALVFDPTLSTTALSNDAFFGTTDDRDTVDSIILNTESEFYQHVPEGFRLDQIVRPERHAVENEGHRAYRDQFMRVKTDYTPRMAEVHVKHAPVLPINSGEGDSVEVRKGPNDWEDVTSNNDDEWELIDPGNGTFLFDFAKVFLDQGVRQRTSADRRWVRVSYRYGARGGSIRTGGQTTLGGSGQVLDSSATPDALSVSDASFLPPAPFWCKIFDETDVPGTAEYVKVIGVDTANDTINVAARGERQTGAVAHSADETVHFAPLYVITTVAKMTAIELTTNDDYSEWLPDTDIPLPAPRKIDEWRNDVQDAISLLS